MIKNREEAGILLAEKLQKYQGLPGVILAVPRGGIPVAYQVARKLGMPLDIVLTKKIGHPLNREYAIGAVSLKDFFLVHHRDISQVYIDREIKTIRERLKEMHHKFMGGKAPESLKNKIVIIIDDGIATGNTLFGTVNMLRKENPSQIIIAVPVSSVSGIEKLSDTVNEMVVLLVPEEFHGVGHYYEDFSQVPDEEAQSILNKWKKGLKKTS